MDRCFFFISILCLLKNVFTFQKMRRVYCVYDVNLLKQCDQLPAVPGRASLVSNLISSYNIQNQMILVNSIPATYNNISKFHSKSYLDHIRLKFSDDLDDDYIPNAEDEKYGLGYDCPPFSNMFEVITAVAGASITAAKSLVLGLADVAINWCGGWHHAQRCSADGYCYVNDIVLAIETLRQKFPKVLYIDLDVHHGNGVQAAYKTSKSVFTLSFHKFEPGFYPGTGDVDDIGTQAGLGYSCNVPLKAAYSDTTLEYVFESVFTKVYDLFQPDSIVVQCGADALAHDPNGGACLTIKGYTSCLQRVLDKRKPMILLGGGGYNHPNTARLWTSLTAHVVGVSLDENIPEHDDWPSYGPDYCLNVAPTLIKDTNTQCYLDKCIAAIHGNLEKYLGALYDVYDFREE